MSTFPLFHGITLAENSWIENLHVEILASDPVPLTAGRVWYNSALKAFRQSTLDGTGAVVVRTFGTAEELVAVVGALSNLTTTEKTNIVAAINEVVTSVSNEASARAAADGDLATLTTEAKGNLVAAINEVDANVDAEVLRATGVEGNLATLTTDAKGNLVAAINEVDAAVDAEALARAAADGDLAALTTDAKGNLVAAINEVDAHIDAEVLRATGVEGDLATLTTTSKTSLVGAINEVDGNVDALALQVAALGNAFNYVGAVTGGADTAAAFDLTTLPGGGTDAGDYYKVTTAGYFKVGAAGTPFFANIGDGLVFNTFGGVDKIDNTDSNVAGTANEIAVTGSADTGFTVGIDTAFKDRVSTLETEAANAQTAVGLSATGEYVAVSGSNYLDTTTTFRGADLALDAAVKAVQDEVDATQAGAGLSVAGAYVAPTGTTYLGAATSLADADVKLDAAVKAEVDRAKAAEGDLTLLTTDAKTDLVSAINELDAAVAGGTEAVRDAYDATIFTYESTVAATSHVINHNLNSPFVDFSVMIQRADGNWYNDIASIATNNLNPNNSATLYLSVAQNVRIIARSAVKLGLVA